MKKIIFLLLLTSSVFAQISGGLFLPELKLGDQRLWIGSHWIKDSSTNYFVFNQGAVFYNSLYVGIKGGDLYFDTSSQVRLFLSGFDFYIDNQKDYGSHYYYIGEKNSAYYWYKSSGGASQQLMQLDTISGFTLTYGNIQVSSGTQQIKFLSDTASDYDGDDGIILNKQSGTLTTKSLTTMPGAEYTLSLTNSLITATSRVIPVLSSGTNTTIPALLTVVAPTAGSCAINIYNGHASNAFNGTIKIMFLVIN